MRHLRGADLFATGVPFSSPIAPRGCWAGPRPSAGGPPALCCARSRIRCAHTLHDCCQQSSPGSSLEAVSGAGTALAHRPKRPLRSQCSSARSVLPWRSASFAFCAWFCRYAPGRPCLAGRLFPVRRFRRVLAKPLRCVGLEAAAGAVPLGAVPVLNPRAGARGSRLWSVVWLLFSFPPGFGPLALACPPGSPLGSVVGGPARGV